VDDGGQPLVITGPDERESGIDTSKATQPNDAGQGALLMITEEVVPNNIQGMDTMEVRDGVALSTTWTLDIYIKLPLAPKSNTLPADAKISYRSLFSGIGGRGEELGSYHAVVKVDENANPTKYELGVYTSGTGPSTDPAGNPCHANTFYSSGIDFNNPAIFAKRDNDFIDRWYRLTIVGGNGQERFYINGALSGLSKCQITSDLSFIGNFLPKDWNGKFIKGGATQAFGKFALVKIFDHALLSEAVMLLASSGPTSDCDLGCQQKACAELIISKSCKGISENSDAS
jgi:hypothetical protein